MSVRPRTRTGSDHELKAIMHRHFLFFMLALAAIVFPVSQTHGEASDISAATRSVVRVAMFSSSDGQRRLIAHGSGVVVAADRIVTNAHVVADAQYDESMTFVIIPSEGSDSYQATLVAVSASKDLALLKLEGGARLIPASVYTGLVADGADVFAIGYPANVDIALELSEDDLLRPQAPVKTRGSISSGRTSKSVDSLLHTAPIAPGSSGGPLVDACGRVIGINSFGSIAAGGGAEFYFAVSTRELSAFLDQRDVPFSAATSECRSVAELTRAEAEREAAERAKIEAENRIAAELRIGKEGKFRRAAEHEIIAARENHIALAGLLLVFAAVAGGAAWQFHERGRRRYFKGAAAASGICLLATIILFATRPSFDEVESRVRSAMAPADGTPDNSRPAVISATSRHRCVIQPERSRITVSDTADMLFEWTENGCINGRTQYVDNAGTWSRSFVPNNDAQVSLVSYTPASKTYRIERYLLGMEAMTAARAARKRYDVQSCSTDMAVRDSIDNMNKAVREILPTTPNELLIYACDDVR
jgi:serine protease Do